MKLFVIVLLCSVAACVYGENCTVNAECINDHFTCGVNYHKICEHKHEVGVTTGGGLCTCAVNNIACTDKDVCVAAPELSSCPMDRRHCYDGKCICTRREFN
ncbi:uncharacterized protein LOC128205242 [Mya arenaria]|uniref:uncharacterized protein LOC128205242 n=1 Tax=Mya arenaria TaxID=6604 RepID=UPI0022E970E5|nr:uncharacterized protein LOC128205242 [Mya arenaria]